MRLQLVASHRHASRWIPVIVDLYMGLMISYEKKQTNTNKLIQKQK